VRILPRRRYATVEITTAYAPGAVLTVRTVERLWAMLQDVRAPRGVVSIGLTHATCSAALIPAALEIALHLSACVRQPGALRTGASADHGPFSRALK
jgi:hypothetical protein